MLGTILIVLLILMLLGAFSQGGNWGYGPSGGLGLVLLICDYPFLARISEVKL